MTSPRRKKIKYHRWSMKARLRILKGRLFSAQSHLTAMAQNSVRAALLRHRLPILDDDSTEIDLITGKIRTE